MLSRGYGDLFVDVHLGPLEVVRFFDTSPVIQTSSVIQHWAAPIFQVQALKGFGALVLQQESLQVAQLAHFFNDAGQLLVKGAP